MGSENLIDIIDEEEHDLIAGKIKAFDRSDVERNQLIRKLYDENIALKEELHRKTAEYAAELKTRREWQKKADDAALVNLQHAQLSIQSYNYILVLIDGNNFIFQENFLEKGLSGGAEAARSLREEIQKRFEYIDPATTKPFKIMVRIYLNLDGLFQALDRAGLVQDAETIRHFSRGFTQFQSLFDLVDVGFDHSYVRLKMEEVLELCINSVQCKQVLLGCHSDDLSKILKHHKQNLFITNRITLLKTAKSKSPLPASFGTAELPSIFRSSALPVSRASKEDSEHLAIQNWNSGQFPTDSSQSQIKSESPSFDSQSSMTSKSKTRGYNSSVVPANAGETDIASWQSAVDNDDPPLPAHLPTEWGPSQRIVLLNLDDERVDSHLGPVDQSAADRVNVRCETKKLCNDFHLRDRCWTSNCPYSHEPRLSTKELIALRYKARMLVCERGSSCRSVDCWYGHMCAQEPCRKSYGCRFRDVHHVNKTAVRVWRKPPNQSKREEFYEEFI